MLISQQKLKENIAEYILYMYQMEDIIRAYKFDVEQIIENYAKPQLPDASFIGQYRSWLLNLIDEMKSSRAEKQGHIVSLSEIMAELNYLHNTLLNVTKDVKYTDVYERAVPFLDEFKEKSDKKQANHIEMAFQAMYMKLLLKLQKKEISAESEEAFDSMRIMLAYLSRGYHKMKAGDLDFLKN
jgi:hypothetical protein